jgi:glycosyltransferase involved in cell wall biosynthesis
MISSDLSVTVVVTTFNDGDYLDECLISILAQTEPPSQIIVVDDGSNKNESISAINIAKKTYKDVQFVHQKNGGPSSARNMGLSFVENEYVCFIDVDDRLKPENLLEKKRLFIDSDSDLVCVYGGFEYSYPNGVTVNSKFLDYEGHIDPQLIGRAKGIPGGLPMYLFKSRALQASGGLDKKLWIKEDFDLLIRLGLRGGKTRGSNTSLYKRTYRDDSLSRSNSFKVFLGTLKFINKARKMNYYPTHRVIKEYFLCYLSLFRSLLK